jgi:hypothetical protein
MRKLVLLCTTLFTVVLSMSASPVWAQNTLFVSPVGSDANGCSANSPCATFQGALNKGSVSQINCLGTGFYGPLVITGSVTVDCGTGNVGNIVSSSTSGITINTTAAATIILRHLSMNGLQTGTSADGIRASSFFSGTLIVEDCMIQGYHFGFGINFAPGSSRGLLQVSNTQIFDNFTGITDSPQGSVIASVTLNRVEVVANLHDGVSFSGTGITAGTMRDSVVGENGGSGVIGGSSQVFFTIEESSIIANLVNGIQSTTANAILNVGSSTIGGNGTGVKATAGQLISFGNNQMSANGVNGSFTSTTPLL